MIPNYCYYILLTALSLPSMLFSQSPEPAAARVPVTIVLSDRVPANSRFVARRLPGAAHRDVIMLRQDATTAELTAAVNTLLTARHAEGDVPRVERTVRVRPKAGDTRLVREYPWAGQVLTDLRSAAPSEIPGIGKVRAIEVWLPRQSHNGPERPGRRG